MDMVAFRREHTSWNIQQNPTTVTIQRTEKVKVNGGYREQKSQVGPFVVRIFSQGSKGPEDVSDLAGTQQKDKSWGLLADYQADLQAGPNVQDEFEVLGLGFFRIVAVYPQLVMGQIVGYQADLERVS